MKRWTDEQLRDAVAQSRNVSQVLRVLGLRPVGGNYDTVRHYIKVLNLETSHWSRSTRRPVLAEDLRQAVRESDSVASALARVGWPAPSASRKRVAAGV